MDFCQKVLPDACPLAAADAPVPLSEIDAELRKEYNAEQIAPGAIPWLSMHLFNAFHLPSNDALKLTKDLMQIKAIKIPITQKTRKYTKKDFVPVVQEAGEEDYIFLAYEEQAGYHYSNSNRLFLEAALAKGITQKDIEQDTLAYKDYMFYRKCYLELYNADG